MSIEKWEKRNTGTIGDVKYSILNPQQFEIVNGDGWVLLDGNNLDTNSDLYKLLNSTGQAGTLENGKLPNGDGVFIRGYDTNKIDTYGDPDKARSVGEFPNRPSRTSST